MNYFKAGNFLGSNSQLQNIPDAVSRRRKLSVLVAAAVVGSSMITVQDVEAAGSKKKLKNKSQTEKVVNDLQAENTRLREQLLQFQAAQRNPGGTQAATGLGAVPDNTEAAAGVADSAEVVAKKEAAETDNLGEVVVKGKVRSRLEKVKDVPSSSSVRSGEELNRQLSQDLGSILQRAGNVKWNSGNSRTSSLSIRGVGQQAQTDAMDPSVGTIVDGVPYAYNPLTSFDHYDIDQVEVARGPQGTLGGKNAILGAINLTTKRPTFTPEANYSLAYGQYNTYIADAAGGGAVIDGLLAFRGAIHVNKADGATTNLWNSDQTWYNRDRASGRIQFLLTPTENFSARISYDKNAKQSEFYNGNLFFTPTPTRYANGAVNSLSTDASTRLNRRWFTASNPGYTYQKDYLYGGGQHAFNQDAQFPLVTDSQGGSAELNWDVGGFKLSSITAVRDYNFQARNDEGTPFDISKNGGGAVPDFLQLSQELKLSSSFGKWVDYSGGIYLMDRKQTKGNRVGFGSDAGAWFASTTQYNILDTNSQGRQLMQNSLDGLDTNGPYFIHNQTGSVFANAKWHITEPLSVTTGVRFSNESREQQTQKLITSNGVGGALNPVSVNGVQTGGFNSNSTTGVLTGVNSAAQTALANSVAQQYFNVATYAGLDPTQMAQVATAKAIRKTNMGVLWDKEPGRSFKSTQPGYVISPSYKINEDLTTYVSWQYGEKAGFSQTPNAIAVSVLPEKTNSYEIGFKSSMFDKALTLNTDFFYTDISNYQQAVQVVDDYTTNLARVTNPSAAPIYISSTGNAKGVRALGVEIDGSFNGIPYTSVNFSGSYNDAIYTDFKNSAKPLEQNYPGSPAYQDVTGKTLPGAAKFAFNIGPEVRIPLQAMGINGLGKNEFHTSFNTSFTSSYKSDVSLSDYSTIKANSYTDFSVGIGRRDKLFDLSLVGKNIFNNQTPTAILWNSWTPGLPQWFGVMVSGKI